jgi:hypothetical protein
MNDRHWRAFAVAFLVLGTLAGLVVGLGTYGLTDSTTRIVAWGVAFGAASLAATVFARWWDRSHPAG